METKGLVLFLLVFCCVSCDISTAFVIDGQKEYVLSTECGIIKIKGSSFPGLPILMGCTFNGEYHINIDSLQIEAVPDEVVITNIRFQLNLENFTETEIKTKADDTLSIGFNIESVKPFQSPDVTILILPSSFITCNGKNIINDTITIQLKN